MKKHIHLLGGLLLLLILSFQTSAQSNYDVQDFHSMFNGQQACDTSLYLSVAADSMPWAGNGNYLLWTSGTNFSPGTWELTVDWGDGQITTHTGQSSSPAQEINWQPTASHFYPDQDASYNVLVTFTNPANQSSATTGFTHHVNSCNTEFYGSLNLDCDGDGNVDSTIHTFPFDVILTSTGLKTDINLNNGFHKRHLSDGNYTIAFDQNWLNSNNFIGNQMSPGSFTINSGGVVQFVGTISCDTTSTYIATGCFDGHVWCDANQNGVYDANETVLSGAPIEVIIDGQMHQTQTNTNGYYSLVYSYDSLNPPSGQACIDTAWLIQNGYTSPNTFLPNQCQNFQAQSCGLSQPINFPIQCDSTGGGGTSVTGCASGFVWCDANQNGVLDSTEMPLASAPVQVFLNGMVYQTQTNGSGQYSIQYAYDSTNVPSGQVCLDTAWLYQQGYASPNTPVPNHCQGFQGAPCGTSQAINFPIICDSIQQVQACISGIVFCDDNNNGVMDSLESGINGAPVYVYVNNSTALVYTDSNGHFQHDTIVNGGGQSALICMDQNWMTQHGYQPHIFCDTAVVIDCGNPNNQPVLFPIDCDTLSGPQQCVEGYVFCDNNQNGVFDAGDVPIAQAALLLNSQSTNLNVTLFTNANGHFSYSGPGLGTSVTVFIDSTWLSTYGYTGPSTFTISTDCSQGLILNIPLDCSAINTCTDMYATVQTWIGYFQNNNNYIKIKWGTHGPFAPGDYTLSLTYPAGVTPVTSTFNNQNYTIAGNTITWTMNSNSTQFQITDVIGFFVPMGYPSGTPHTYIVQVLPLNPADDCELLNNKDELTMILGNSYDPNDKTVDQPENLDPDADETLTYRIRFQNTGTAPAQDVYIMDTLDANLDWSTLKLVDFSHNMQLIDEGNGVIRFDFPDIWLPDSNANEPESHGYVRYTIKEKPSLPLGSEIENTAYIYFDWNPAIITNTTYNINETLGLMDEVMEQTLVYPNPSKGIIHIQAQSPVSEVLVMTMDGKVVHNEQGTNVNNLNLNSLSSGVYLIQLRLENGATNVHRVHMQQ